MATAVLQLNALTTNLLDRDRPNAVLPVTEETAVVNGANSFFYKQALIAFEQFPAALQYNKLEQIQLIFYTPPRETFSGQLYTWSCGPFDPSAVSWNAKPIASDRFYRNFNVFSSLDPAYQSFAIGERQDGSFAPNAQAYLRGSGLLLAAYSGSALDDLSFYTQASEHAPYLYVIYDDAELVTSQVAQQNCPTGGYVNRGEANTFQWSLEGKDYCVGRFVQAAATLYWKLSTADSYTAVNVSGTTQQVTVPANTFPSGTIQWYLAARDTQGNVSTTPLYSFSTADTETTATPVSPINEILDGSKPVTLSWSTANNYGNPPSGAKIQVQPSGESWEDLATVSGAERSYTAPANTLPVGSFQWRVLAYNLDGTPGPYSDGVSVINVAASPAPAVTVDAVPFAAITWSASGQQAYRVRVDETDYGIRFGEDKQFAIPAPLAPGTHLASVTVQNLYGLWSEPGETTFDIPEYSGSETVTLSAQFGADAVLQWAASSASADYYVFRDDELIARTSEPGYIDRFSLGEHSYQVLNRLADGYAVSSDTVTGTTAVTETMIGLAEGTGWLSLRLSEKSRSEQNFTSSRSYSLQHISGAQLPVLELSPYEDGSGSYDAAFTDPTQLAAFEAMLGQVVVLKSRGGNVLIGALTQYQKVRYRFYAAVHFTVQRIHWEAYHDENA